jgi:uncharacterized protein YhaN
MATPASPSAALVRTARSEIDRIDRAIATIEQRRAALHAQLSELDVEVEGYARRKQLLEELVYVEQGVPTAATAADARPARRAVKGVELRRVAGRLLWSTQGDREIHYREWFERLIAEGYAVGGKDPVASFLTNIRDSAAVQRGSSQGHYRLDSASISRVAQQTSEVRAELVDLEQSIGRAYADPSQPQTIEPLREHRHRLKQLLKRLEATLAELHFIFDDERSESNSAANEEPAIAA